MTWAPGQPVRTETDRAEWAQWRRDRKRQLQRERRATNPRIDYYPDAYALPIVRRLQSRYAGGDLSSVLNRIVREWAERCHRN